jgi:hypothetical protein
MMNLLMYAFYFVLSTAIFEFSYLYGGIDRTFIGLNKGIAESSLLSVDAAGNPLSKPYFSADLFEVKTNEYFRVSLSGYLVDDPSLTYWYFDYSTLAEVARKANPTGIKVTLRCAIGCFGEYNKSISFALREGIGNA